MTNYQAGHLAEFWARMYMRLLGYHIIAQNYITGRGTTVGEVDFIAHRGHTLVFVEVKKRSSSEKAAYAIQPRQQQRLIRAATHFVAQHPPYQKDNIRFDAILIVPPFTLHHIKNAWQA